MIESWEASQSRVMRGGRANRAELPRGSNGRILCRWCRLEVPPGRRTFCSDWCVHEWRLRTDPGYLRERLFERDRGICAVCGADTVAWWNHLRRLPAPRRRVLLREWGIEKSRRRSLWDADHIVPVSEGGGECDLSNLRTLCLHCHREATARLRDRLKERRVSANAGEPRSGP